MKFKNLIKKVFKIAALAICLSIVTLQAPYVHKKYIRSIAEQSVVQIYGQNGTGTGSHVQLPNGKIVILTNKHICQMTGPLTVKSVKNKLVVERKIILISEDHDLCAIEPLDGVSGIKIGSAPELGDELYTLGHPRGDALNVSKGEYFDDKKIQLGQDSESDGSCKEGKPITQDTIFGPVTFCVIERTSIQLSTPTYPGNSGSPVLNKYGRLVAVIFAGNPSIENQGFAVPLSAVKEFLALL